MNVIASLHACKLGRMVWGYKEGQPVKNDFLLSCLASQCECDSKLACVQVGQDGLGVQRRTTSEE